MANEKSRIDAGESKSAHVTNERAALIHVGFPNYGSSPLPYFF